MVKKKKLFICSSICFLSVAIGALFLTSQKVMVLNANETVNTLTINASNTVNGADTSGAKATGTVKTATGYDVTLSVGDFRANANQAGIFRNGSGFVTNTTPVRGITKLGICANQTVGLEVGYKVDDTIYWEFTSQLTVQDFAGGVCRMYTVPSSSYPVNYFRFRSSGFTQVKKIEVQYSCGDVDEAFTDETRLNVVGSYTDNANNLLVKSKKDSAADLGISNQTATDNYTFSSKVNVQGRADYTYEMGLPKRSYWKPFEGFRFQTNYKDVVVKMDGNVVITTTEATKGNWFTIMVSANKKVFVDGTYVYTLSEAKGNGVERIDFTVVTNSSATYAFASFTRLFAYVA